MLSSKVMCRVLQSETGKAETKTLLSSVLIHPVLAGTQALGEDHGVQIFDRL
jgi:hypothetical protein